MASLITDNPGDAHMAFAFLLQVSNDWKGVEPSFQILMMLNSLSGERRSAIVRELVEQGLLENVNGRWKATAAGDTFLESPFRSSW